MFRSTHEKDGYEQSHGKQIYNRYRVPAVGVLDTLVVAVESRSARGNHTRVREPQNSEN